MSGKYSNIKVVSFDMDGTILNTEADLEAAARRALKLAGLPPMPPDCRLCRRFVLLSISEMV